MTNNYGLNTNQKDPRKKIRMSINLPSVKGTS